MFSKAFFVLISFLIVNLVLTCFGLWKLYELNLYGFIVGLLLYIGLIVGMVVVDIELLVKIKNKLSELKNKFKDVITDLKDYLKDLSKNPLKLAKVVMDLIKALTNKNNKKE